MMHGPLPDREQTSKVAAGNTLVAAVERALAICNNIILAFAALALIAACVILSYSVLGRALFQAANYWQDEASVFLLVGAFCSAPSSPGNLGRWRRRPMSTGRFRTRCGRRRSPFPTG